MESSKKKSLPELIRQSEFKTVQKSKIWTIVSCSIVLLAIVMGFVWGFHPDFRTPVNLSMDFTGGYTMTITLSTQLTPETFDEYFRDRILEIGNNLVDEDGDTVSLGLNPRSLQLQGEGPDASVLIRYRGISKAEWDTSEYMESLNDIFQRTLVEQLFVFRIDNITRNGNVFAVRYYESLNFLRHAEIAQHVTMAVQNSYLGNDDIGKTYLQVAADSVVLSDDGYVISITISNLTEDNAAQIQEKLASVMPIPDRFAGRPGEVNTVSERMGGEHMRDAILAIIAALVFMLVYIAFRFEVSMGAAAVLGLFHDLILMFSFMVIFHIEIGIVFFAALITLLGYSINNTIIIFDKVRENIKMYGNKPYDSFHVANISARDTLFRSLSTTVTTLFPIAMIAIIGVPAIQIFALPIIVGLFSGTYSSLTIVPAVWANWKRRIFKKRGEAVAFAGAGANVDVEMPQEVESIVNSAAVEDKPTVKKAAVSKNAKPKIVRKTTKAVGAVTDHQNENEVFEEFMEDKEKIVEDSEEVEEIETLVEDEVNEEIIEEEVTEVEGDIAESTEEEQEEDED